METTTSIIERIKQAKINAEAAEAKKQADKELLRIALLGRIKGLAPRINELFSVAEELTLNGFYLGNLTPWYSNIQAPEFVTEGIDHRVGFFLNGSPYSSFGGGKGMPTHIGIMNGGCNGNIDLKIDRFGSVVSGAYIICDMQKFLNRFDEFEQKFYSYIDAL